MKKIGRERKIASEHIESDFRYHCQRSPMSPSIYIIAGPNGVGKTTFAREFLPNYANCRNFINADLIAQGIAPFSPETAAFRAGKLMLTEIDLLAQRRADFGFETTLSGRSYLRLIGRLKNQGYYVHFFFRCRALIWHCRESKVGCPREVMTCQRLTSAVGLTAQSRISWSCIVLWRIHGFSLTTH